jgi:outer membrane receptor protein involved in Fe transport
VSSFYSLSGATRFEAPGYTIASAQIGYELSRRLALTLTVNNVLDEKYYEKVSAASRQNFYGEPLNATLAVRTVF